MKKMSLLAAVAVLLLGTVTAFGQERPVAPEAAVAAPQGPAAPSPAVTVTGVVVTPQGPTAPPPGVNTFTFVNSEFMFDGKPVKGAPYSAQATTETSQTLADGNRIVNRSTASVYRDSDGRTRREQTLKSIGGMGAGEPLKTIMISDPIAGVSYTLDPQNRVARRAATWRYERTPPPSGNMIWQSDGFGAGAGQASTQTFSATRSATSEVRVAVAPGSSEPEVFTARTPAPEAADAAKMATELKMKMRNPEMEGGRNFTMEKLGHQNIEGVDAEGTRSTITIAAGAIGNERPIEIVDERWYSAELQTMVMTRHSDPRSGEMIYRLTNIDRSEQPHSLFEIPADYQMKEMQPPMPMKARKPMDQ